MSEPRGDVLVGVREEQVEERLRDLLGPLDVRLDRASVFLGLGLMAGTPVAFFVLWLVVSLSWWLSLLLAFGFLVVWVGLGLHWEQRLVEVTAREFDLRFPEGTFLRTVAMTLLAEMDSPQKAGTKLQEYLASRNPANRVTRQRPRASPDLETIADGVPLPLSAERSEQIQAPVGTEFPLQAPRDFPLGPPPGSDRIRLDRDGVTQ